MTRRETVIHFYGEMLLTIKKKKILRASVLASFLIMPQGQPVCVILS